MKKSILLLFNTAIALSAASATYTSIDMGLSVRWATCNVGASSSASAGDRYTWGGIEPNITYSWATYRYGSVYNAMTKYCTNSSYGKVDNLTTLEATDDAATHKWGNEWRTPSLTDWEELRTRCTWRWETNYNNSNVKGYTVTAPNGNAIFLPVTGLGYDNQTLQTGEGFYWSRSLSPTPNKAFSMQFSATDTTLTDDLYRYYGLAVRPVQDIYAITIPTLAHGSLSADKTQAVGGETVTLQVHSEAYYILRKLCVMQGETEVQTTAVEQTTNQYTFVMPVGAVTVTAEFQHIASHFTPAPFTVNSAGKQIYFAPGNLQCAGLTTHDTVWSFAEYQTDMLGTDNIRDNALADTIDLFAWSSNYTTAPWGIGTSTSSDDYEGDFVDWGQNPIGTYAPNTYHTPCLYDWQYILQFRKNAEERVAVARINLNTDGTQYANGLILLPDDWTCPTDVSFKTGFLETTGGSIYGYANYQTLALSDWQKLEAAGAVFLPATGERAGTNVRSEQSFGYYWLSDIKDVRLAACLSFYAGKADVYYNYHHLGQAVRLVQDVKYAITLIDDDHGILDSNIEQGTTGEKVALSIIPDTGYELDQLTVTYGEGQRITVADDYTFTMPASAVTVTASFKKVNYRITISNEILNGEIRVATEIYTAQYGDEVQLAVIPDMDYELDQLTVTDTEGNEIETKFKRFTMPASAVTVMATFAPKTPSALQETETQGAETQGAEAGAEAPNIRIENGRIICPVEFRIYDLLGHDVTHQNGTLNGIYIIQVGATVQKISLLSAQ